ncbi:MAG: ATP-binding cassette domain-containing protein, partial [Treponema sp.]|nr:ATP-binding cassette domain-containing protein [Treponema sp.]
MLDEISFDVFEGEIVGLLGCNGSGKTTLIKSILNLLEIDGGEILYLGQNIKHLKRSLFFTEVNAVLEGERNLYWNMTVKENLLYFGRLKNIPGKKIIEQGNEYLRILGLLENLKT